MVEYAELSYACSLSCGYMVIKFNIEESLESLSKQIISFRCIVVQDFLPALLSPNLLF